MRWAIPFLVVVAPCLGAGAGPIPAGKLKWMESVMDEIYRMHYEEAAEASRQRIASAPDDPAGYVLLARTYWAQEMIRKHAFSISRFAAPDFFAENQQDKYKIKVDPVVEKRFLDTTNEAIERANAVIRKDSRNPEAMFLLGLAYQNEVTFHASIEGGWWAAFGAGRRTHDNHRRVYRAFPDFKDPLLAMGVYQYVAGSLPWSIRWLTFLVGSGGSKKKGLEMLERAAQEAELVGDDARTVLALIYAREKNYGASFQKLTELGDKYPENYLFQVDRATLARRLNQPEVAKDILETLLETVWNRPDVQPVLERAQIYTQIGLAFRDMGKPRAAENFFQIALKEPNLSSWLRVSIQDELTKSVELKSQPAGASPAAVLSGPSR